MGCNGVHVETCDCLVSFEDIIGSPEKNPQLVDFVDKQIKKETEGLKEGLSKTLDSLTEDIKKEVEDALGGLDGLDAYDIKYKDTTVGEALDKLETTEELSGTISEFPIYEKGRVVNNLNLVWDFNKPVDKVKILCKPAYDNDEVIDVDPAQKSFEFNGITGNQTFVVVGATEDGEECRLVSKVNFKLRYYWGSHTEKNPCNEAIIGLTSRFEDFKDTNFKGIIGEHIINCSGGEGEYMFFFFPNDLHLDYSFFTNGMKDSNFDVEVKTVSNKYGYQAPYRVYRSGNRLTGSEIFVEVHAHDCY